MHSRYRKNPSVGRRRRRLKTYLTKTIPIKLAQNLATKLTLSLSVHQFIWFADFTARQTNITCVLYFFVTAYLCAGKNIYNCRLSWFFLLEPTCVRRRTSFVYILVCIIISCYLSILLLYHCIRLNQKSTTDIHCCEVGLQAD